MVCYETSGEVIEVDQNVFRLKSGEGKLDCALKNKMPENLTVGTVIRIFGFFKNSNFLPPLCSLNPELKILDLISFLRRF